MGGIELRIQGVKDMKRTPDFKERKQKAVEAPA